MRVVIDASVLAPALLSERGSAFELMNYWRADLFTLILSQPIIDEIIRTQRSAYFFDRGVREGQIRQLVESLETTGIVVPLTERVSGIASHPEDDLVLSTAVSGAADYLVTHDKQLLALGVYQGIRIVRPGVILGHLQQESP